MPFVDETQEVKCSQVRPGSQEWRPSHVEQKQQKQPRQLIPVDDAVADLEGAGSASHDSACSVPSSQHDLLMDQYRRFFKERGVSLQELEPKAAQGKSAVAMQRKRKRGKLGMGRPPPQMKTKKEQQEEDRERKRRASDDQILHGPNRHVYAPHLHLLYERE